LSLDLNIAPPALLAPHYIRNHGVVASEFDFTWFQLSCSLSNVSSQIEFVLSSKIRMQEFLRKYVNIVYK